MIYAINYDLKRPGQNYDALYDAIKSCGVWWHHLDSTWLVDMNRPGFAGGSNFQIGWSHDEQNDEQVFP